MCEATEAPGIKFQHSPFKRIEQVHPNSGESRGSSGQGMGFQSVSSESDRNKRPILTCSWWSLSQGSNTNDTLAHLTQEGFIRVIGQKNRSRLSGQSFSLDKLLQLFHPLLTNRTCYRNWKHKCLIWGFQTLNAATDSNSSELNLHICCFK